MDAIISSKGMAGALRHPTGANGEQAQTHVTVTCGELDGFTLSVWVDMANIATFSNYVIGAALATTVGTNNPTVGALGISGARLGRLYSQPGDNTNASRSPTWIMGQGPTHLAMRCARVSPTQFLYTTYVNCVPQHEVTITREALNISGYYGGAYSANPATLASSFSRIKPGDPWDYIRFTPWCITEEQLSEQYERERIQLGYPKPKCLGIFCADSLMAFGGAPSWSIASSAVLRPGFFAALDAWGGTYYGTTGNLYASPTRRGLRQRMIKYGSRHHEKVIVFWPYGTNDIGGGGRPMSGANWIDGANTIDAMIAEDRNTADDPSNVENWGQTIIPRADFLTSKPLWEANRQAYNTWRKANPGPFAKIIDAAAWVPPGHASFEDCVLHAANNNGNIYIKGDGIHHNDGAMMAEEVYIPEFEQALAA